jgi:hypothetical protein
MPREVEVSSTVLSFCSTSVCCVSDCTGIKWPAYNKVVHTCTVVCTARWSQGTTLMERSRQPSIWLEVCLLHSLGHTHVAGDPGTTTQAPAPSPLHVLCPTAAQPRSLKPCLSAQCHCHAPCFSRGQAVRKWWRQPNQSWPYQGSPLYI